MRGYLTLPREPVCSAEAMEAVGRQLAQVLGAGDVLALVGPLGAGKTTLVRGLAAGLGIVWTAAHRLVDPQPLEAVGLGLALSLGSSLINGALAYAMLRRAREYRSAALEAHTMATVASATTATATAPVTSLCRRTWRHATSHGFSRRALTGSPSSHRRRSSASATAVG